MKHNQVVGARISLNRRKAPSTASQGCGACAVDGNYAYYNGTSMAAPPIAGVAVLWLAQAPSLTPKTLLEELQKSARPRDSTQCPKPCGAGLLSAVRKVPTGVQVSLLFSSDKSIYQLGENAARVLLRWVGERLCGRAPA